MLYSFWFSIFVTFVCALISISFYTLFERKMLGYFQNRKGPNKVGLIGIPQPFADAIKLFTKEQIKLKRGNFMPFFISPVFRLVLSLLLWTLFPHFYPRGLSKFGVLIFLVISSLSVYGTMVAGWASNSKYALLGALRGVAQTISYEVSMTLILLSPLIVYCCFNINEFIRGGISIPVFLFIHIFFMWGVSVLAETNRTPFDFAEGESELVSGFNTEYSGYQFAVLFIAEYTRILAIRILTSSIFLHGFTIFIVKNLILLLACLFISLTFIWARASFPRIRYDKLINLTWKSFLPISLSILVVLFPLANIIYL